MISVIIFRFMIISRVCGLKTGMNIAKNKKPRYWAGLNGVKMLIYFSRIIILVLLDKTIRMHQHQSAFFQFP